MCGCCVHSMIVPLSHIMVCPTHVDVVLPSGLSRPVIASGCAGCSRTCGDSHKPPPDLTSHPIRVNF